jgi:peptidoglycan/LPS O-acetylase OafA/YrhL
MTYKNIQGMRAVAALMVFVTHIFYPIESMRTHWAAPYFDAVGPAGVDIFFVISGFIIFVVARRAGELVAERGRVAAVRDFAVRRVIRIYPIYWIIFIVAGLLMPYVELMPSWIEHRPTFELLLLIAQPNDHVMAAWTLTFEVYYYLAATLVILLFPRHVFVGLMIWFLVIFGVNVAAFALGKTWMFNIFFASILFEFMFGMVVAQLIQSRVTGFGLGSLLIGIAGFFIGAEVYRVHGGWGPLPSWWRMGCFGLPAAFIIYGIVSLEVRQKWTFPKLWEKLGDASYSLYLWHQLVFAVLVAISVKLGLISRVPGPILAVVFLAIGLGVGLASFRYIEKPILAVLGKLLLGRRIQSASIEPAPVVGGNH